jgi:hypothetical protein
MNLQRFVVYCIALVLCPTSSAHPASVQEIESVRAGFAGWVASYGLLDNATVIGNASQFSPGGHPFQHSPSVLLGSYWGNGPVPGQIAFYEAVASAQGDAAAHYALTSAGACYVRTSHQNYPPGIQPFDGTAPALVGDFWDGSPVPGQIVDYQAVLDGVSVVHTVFLADGSAWYRVSGGMDNGPVVFNQPPYFLGQFYSDSPVPVSKTTLGNIKAKYR